MDVRKEAVGIAAVVLLVLPLAGGGFWVVKSLAGGPTKSKAEVNREEKITYVASNHPFKMVEADKKKLPTISDFLIEEEKEEMILEEGEVIQVVTEENDGEDAIKSVKNEDAVSNESLGVDDNNNDSAKSSSKSKTNESKENVNRADNRNEDDRKKENEVQDEEKENTVKNDKPESSLKDKEQGKDNNTENTETPNEEIGENSNAGNEGTPEGNSAENVVEPPTDSSIVENGEQGDSTSNVEEPTEDNKIGDRTK